MVLRDAPAPVLDDGRAEPLDYRSPALEHVGFEEKYLQERDRAEVLERKLWQLKAKDRAARLRKTAGAVFAIGGYGAFVGTVVSAVTHNCYKNGADGQDATMSILAPALIGMVVSMIAASVWQAMREPGDEDFPAAPPPRTFGM
jgi:hypothetical protein